LIHHELNTTAKRKYTQALGTGQGKHLAETRASSKTQLVCKKLSADFFATPEHPLGTIGIICRKFKADAFKDAKRKVRQIKTVPMEVNWEDGGSSYSF
jgi:hypothetical protein